MANRHSVTEDVRREVSRRSHGLCEYCHTTEQWQYVRFTIDHVIPLSNGGSHGIENLAYACFPCNRYKSNRSTGIDPASGNIDKIFNPRQQNWAEYFVWSNDGSKIFGLTSIGRTTVSQLKLNRPRIIDIRLADVGVGRHPPKTDPIQVDTK